MAWNVHWQGGFTSREGTAYTVKIYEQNYSGSVVTLQLSDTPFTTGEGDDDDVFTPMRAQTGRLSVMDNDGTLMQQIIPETNTEKYVTVEAGGAIKWQGFISCETYNQEWVESTNPTEITFALNGLLESLKYVNLQSSDFSKENNLANLIYYVFSMLNVPNLTTLFIGGEETNPGAWLAWVLRWRVLFTQFTQTNAGTSYTDYQGNTGYEVMEAICTFFGLTAREDGTGIYLTAAECAQGNNLSQYAWNTLQNYTGSGSAPTTYPTLDLMQNFAWKGDNNDVNYRNGYRNVVATLPLNTDRLDVIEIPDTEENMDPVLSTSAMYWNLDPVTVYMQPHQPRGAEFMETYRYDKYRNEGKPVRIGGSTYSEVSGTTVFNPDWKFYSFNRQRNNEMATGAFPCRWSPDNKSYNSGIYIQFLEWEPWSGYTINLYSLYSIKSRIAFTFNEGYLRLQFNLSGFHIRGLTYLQNPEFYYYNKNFGGFRMLAYIRLGNNYWNGSAWTTSRTYCLLQITDGQPPQNWSADMGVEEKSGYYIPITSEMTGVMQLEILNMVVLNSSGQEYGSRNMILSDFVFEKAQNNNPLVAGRTSNIYRLAIDQKCNDDKDLTLSFGTMNSNSNNPVFLLDSQGNYIETANYQGVQQRPEMNLVGRIRSYFLRHRHSLEAIVHHTFSLPEHRVTHNGKTYSAICAERNWRDDQSRVVWIDVTASGVSSQQQQSLDVEFETDPQEVSGIEESAEPITNEQQEE